MRVDVITIFPAYLEPLRTALVGRALDRGLLELGVHDLRDWTDDVHQAVDDAPFGGGPGMVMRPDVWGAAIDQVAGAGSVLVVPSPAGAPFTQSVAATLARHDHLVFLCGRYEGIDERVLDEAGPRVREISLGDYVLLGGEAAALVIVEAVVRLLPGVLGNTRSAAEDSFSDGLLEGPAYTRPPDWRGHVVPEVLRSGDHARIRAWRRAQSVLRTARRRPELLDDADLSGDDLATLAAAGYVRSTESGRLIRLPDDRKDG